MSCPTGLPTQMTACACIWDRDLACLEIACAPVRSHLIHGRYSCKCLVVAARLAVDLGVLHSFCPACDAIILKKLHCSKPVNSALQCTLQHLWEWTGTGKITQLEDQLPMPDGFCPAGNST